MENQNKFIVEFENGDSPWWLAEWDGDPGRTILRKSAKLFNSELSAKKALAKCVDENSHRALVGRGLVVPA